jgi:pilus assembly protein CpaF
LLGDDVGEEKPVLDARLPDGSRVAAVFPPCAVNGTTVAIRKFPTRRYDAEALVKAGMLTESALAFLREAVLESQNILISGSTGAGKTTLLNALAGLLPEEERLVVIEDTSELQIDKPNVVRLESRHEQADLPAVTIRELLRAALRLRPDRILVGEVRGGEAFDLLQALNTGHRGTLSTVHANSARETLTRLTTCVMMSGVELPLAAVRAQIGDGLDVIVHVTRRSGRRQVSEILRLHTYNSAQDRFEWEVVDAQS